MCSPRLDRIFHSSERIPLTGREATGSDPLISPSSSLLRQGHVGFLFRSLRDAGGESGNQILISVQHTTHTRLVSDGLGCWLAVVVYRVYFIPSSNYPTPHVVVVALQDASLLPNHSTPHPAVSPTTLGGCKFVRV